LETLPTSWNANENLTSFRREALARLPESAMPDPILQMIEAIIQRDVNRRGLASDPKENLITVCSGDFAKACQSLAADNNAAVGIVTGFYIPDAKAAETDGPMGALYLARLLSRLQVRVIILSEPWCMRAIESALDSSGLRNQVSLVVLPSAKFWNGADRMASQVSNELSRMLTHLVAIERVGPSHTANSLANQARLGPVPTELFGTQAPRDHHDHCHTMRGRVITDEMYPAHIHFECAQNITTIGIGDGGNEIGMGKIPWEIIAKNIPNGGLVACRVPTDYNIVCGISNWGAYGLAAGVWHLRGKPFDSELFNPDAERTLWDEVLKEAVLVDGVTGERTLTVDGLSWEDYIRPLREICDLLKNK
jgi:hypothetical protein